MSVHGSQLYLGTLDVSANVSLLLQESDDPDATIVPEPVDEVEDGHAGGGREEVETQEEETQAEDTQEEETQDVQLLNPLGMANDGQGVVQEDG